VLLAGRTVDVAGLVSTLGGGADPQNGGTLVVVHRCGYDASAPQPLRAGLTCVRDLGCK
jgi:hypothetical protein